MGDPRVNGCETMDKLEKRRMKFKETNVSQVCVMALKIQGRAVASDRSRLYLVHRECHDGEKETYFDHR